MSPFCFSKREGIEDKALEKKFRNQILTKKFLKNLAKKMFKQKY